MLRWRKQALHHHSSCSPPRPQSCSAAERCSCRRPPSSSSLPARCRGGGATGSAWTRGAGTGSEDEEEISSMQSTQGFLHKPSHWRCARVAPSPGAAQLRTSRSLLVQPPEERELGPSSHCWRFCCADCPGSLGPQQGIGYLPSGAAVYQQCWVWPWKVCPAYIETMTARSVKQHHLYAHLGRVEPFPRRGGGPAQ